MSRSKRAGDREDARDLPVRVACRCRGSRRSGRRPRSQACDQQLLGAGIVEQALLREHADLEVDRPGVVARRAGARPRSPRRPMRGIDLDMGAHVRGAVRGSPSPACVARARTMSSSVKARLAARDLGDRLLQRAFVDACSGRGCRTCRDGCGSRRSPARPGGRRRLDVSAVGRELRLRSRRSGRRRCRCRPVVLLGRRCARLRKMRSNVHASASLRGFVPPR